MVTSLSGHYRAEAAYSRTVQQQQTSAPVTKTSTSSSKNVTDTATFSQASRDLLANQSAYASLFDTDKGSVNLDIDSYFSSGTDSAKEGSLLQSLPPLLLPSQKNVNALAANISAEFPQFLAKNNIPTAPSSISYDNHGQIQLPDNYAYAEEFNAALENDPAMEKKLRTVNALSSHVAELKKSASFQEEYAATSTQAAAEAVIAKYSNLFSDNRSYAEISLNFSPQGALSITANGDPLV